MEDHGRFVAGIEAIYVAVSAHEHPIIGLARQQDVVRSTETAIKRQRVSGCLGDKVFRHLESHYRHTGIPVRLQLLSRQ